MIAACPTRPNRLFASTPAMPPRAVSRPARLAAWAAAARRAASYALLGAASLLLGACNRHDANQAAASGASSASSAVPAAASMPASAAALASGALAASDSSGTTASFSQGLKRGDLMRVVFPNWHEGNDPAAQAVEVPLPERDGSGRIRRAAGSASAKTVASRIEITPREVIRLDDTHAVMLTEGVGIDDTGVRDDGYAAGAWLGAYFFRRDASGWMLERRVDGVDYLGVAGSLGDTSVTRIGAGEFGLIVTGGGCWQGFCGTWASVYGVAPGRIATYASTVPVDGNNLGASGDCEATLKAASPAHGTAASETDVVVSNDAGSPPACFEVDGKLSLVTAEDGTSEMQIHFDGAETIASGDDGGLRLIHQTAVYRLRDGKYVLSSGHNPVPAF